MDVKVDYLAEVEVGATAPCSSPLPSWQCLTSSRRLQVNHDKKQVILFFLLPQRNGHSVNHTPYFRGGKSSSGGYEGGGKNLHLEEGICLMWALSTFHIHFKNSIKSIKDWSSCCPGMQAKGPSGGRDGDSRVCVGMCHYYRHLSLSFADDLANHLANHIQASLSFLCWPPWQLKSELKFVGTVSISGRVKFLPELCKVFVCRNFHFSSL